MLVCLWSSLGYIWCSCYTCYYCYKCCLYLLYALLEQLLHISMVCALRLKMTRSNERWYRWTYEIYKIESQEIFFLNRTKEMVVCPLSSLPGYFAVFASFLCCF